jgi:hypothetical protein
MNPSTGVPKDGAGVAILKFVVAFVTHEMTL